MNQLHKYYQGPFSEVESFVFHPGWNESNKFLFNDDLVILKLKKPLMFSSSQEGPRPVCLPDFEDFTETMFAAGLGFQNVGYTKVMAKVLHETDLPRRPDQICLSHWNGDGRKHKFNRSQEICGGDLRSPCNGDSGGPVSIRRHGRVYQVGIISYGEITCNLESMVPNVHMKVSYYMDWIKKMTENGKTCSS
jgi:hypothetical protein